LFQGHGKIAHCNVSRRV